MAHLENRFIQSVHRPMKLVKSQRDFYYAKLQVSGNNGWPDCYYSGDLADCWAEYKWISDREFPVRGNTMISIDLSANQRNWLNGRHKEGRQVSCIVGSSHGHCIFHFPFPEEISRADFIRMAMDTQEVREYIFGRTLK